MRVKNLVLGIGIVVVYALVLWQGIQAFYPQPEWDDFCGSRGVGRFPIDIEGGKDCVISGELRDKMNSCSKAEGFIRYQYDDDGCVVDIECDECNINYNEARDEYSRNIFIISLIVGVLTLVVGFFVLKVEPIGSALLASGIWAIFYGTVWNWRNFGNVWRFVLLLIVLVALIWIAWRLNRKKKKGFWFGFGWR